MFAVTETPARRWIAVFAITLLAGGMAYIAAARAFEAPLLPASVAIGLLALGIGVATAAEAGRRATGSLAAGWKAGGRAMGTALLVGACIPAASAGIWPVPAGLLFGASIMEGAPVTGLFAAITALMGAAAVRIPVGWVSNGFAPHLRTPALAAIAAGVLGVGLILAPHALEPIIFL